MERVYLIHIEMPGASHGRLRETLPILQDVLRRLGKFDRLYNTPDSQLLGFIMLTGKNAALIRAALQRGHGEDGGSALRNGDKLMVLELGEDFTWEYFGVIDPYLRHRNTSGQRST